MKTYISLLRGINVTGYRKITMLELAECFRNLNLNAVRTYIQSGNVIFKSDKSISQLEKEIQKGIEKSFGYTDVLVLVFEPVLFKNYIDENPFLTNGKTDTKKLYFTFLKQIPEKVFLDKLSEINLPESDKYIVIGKIVYVCCLNGYGDTKLSNNFFENKLKVRATTRNWNTVNKLVALAFDK